MCRPGHPYIKTLDDDGGWQNWVASGLPVNFASSKPKVITKRVELQANPEIMVTMDELLQGYDDTPLE